MKYIKAFSAIAVSALSAMPLYGLSAYALIDLNTGTGASTSVGASLEADANAEANSSATSSGASGSEVERDTDAEGNAEATSRTQVEINMDSDLMGEGQRMEIDRRDMPIEALGEAEEGEDIQAPNVTTNAELEAYAKNLVRSDSAIESMNFTRNSVEIAYEQEGKFLALVPIAFTVKAIARANGEIELNYPWYSFLTLDNEEELKTELKVAIDNALRARTVGSVVAEADALNARFTAGESAVLIETMRSVLKSNLEAQARTSGAVESGDSQT